MSVNQHNPDGAVRAGGLQRPGRRVRGAQARPRRRGAAFTLLELMVAVGASVLIALALAQLFRTTGDTVTKGRRAAYFNSYASMIQRTLARDFASMSRNGYMIIRHEVTNNRAAGGAASSSGFTGAAGGTFSQARAPLVRGQAALLQRPRRIDELMFFAEGNFASVRDPAHPAWIARSSQARIYYGHGTFSDDLPTGTPFNYNNNGAMSNPNILGRRLGESGTFNAFASDWILLRHVTLLAAPQTAAIDFPTAHLPDPQRRVWGANPGSVATPVAAEVFRLSDKDRQIAGLPAARSVFRALNRAPSPPDFASYPTIGGWRRPNINTFASGLIDIATTDLAEIRSFVMQSHDGVGAVPNPNFPNEGNFAIVGVTTPVPQPLTPRLPNAISQGVGGGGAEWDLLCNMHAWMRNGMPTNSHGDPWIGAAAASEAPRVRMRVADFAENLPAILTNTALQAPAQRFKRSDLIANERMLTSSSLVPHCTEFIVEWSFGEVVPTTGELRWYGSSIPQDDNNDGQVERLGYTYYDYDPANDPPQARLHTDRTTGQLVSGTPSASLHPVDPHLIYGQTYFDATAAGDPRPLVAHFGFTDPTYVPANATQQPSVAWAWPALVRVTITLTDPSDTSLERSFQFTFEVPKAGAN